MNKNRNTLFLGLAMLALVSIACSCGLPSNLPNLLKTETPTLPPTLPPQPTLAPTNTLPPPKPTATKPPQLPTATMVPQSLSPTMSLSKEKIGAAVDPALLAWPIRVFDSFDQNVNNWAEGRDESSIVTNDWKIEDGMYKWTIKAGQKGVYWLSWPDHSEVQDFYLSSMTHKLGGADSADVGLFFRRYDDDNFYIFLVNRVFGRYSIQALIDGNWETLVDWKYTDYIHMNKEPRNSIAVGAQGSHFKFYINGRLVEQLDDDRIGSGVCGYVVDVYGSNDEAVFFFDDFELRVP
jgi:hypothetical protein